MSSWHSYGSIYAFGHRAIQDMFLDPVEITEKVDGSQFSFGLIEEPHVDMNGDHTPYALGESPTYRLRIRSKGAEMLPDVPEKMFNKAVEAVKERLHLLTPGWTYRGEYLAKPKHNALAYDRVPNGHIILFDVARGQEDYMPWEFMAGEARKIGLEAVPLLYTGKVDSPTQLRGLLDQVSVLGGQKIEGVVAKNYKRFGLDHKFMMGKLVSEAFKETHAKVWKADNPNSKDILDRVIETYHSQARWQKGVQHLREAGKLEGSPKDIALLFREIPDDIKKECEDEIKEYLFTWAWPRIQRGVMAGLPEWYKDLLLKAQFEAEPSCETASPEMLKILDSAGDGQPGPGADVS